MMLYQLKSIILHIAIAVYNKLREKDRTVILQTVTSPVNDCTWHLDSTLSCSVILALL